MFRAPLHRFRKPLTSFSLFGASTFCAKSVAQNVEAKIGQPRAMGNKQIHPIPKRETNTGNLSQKVLQCLVLAYTIALFQPSQSVLGKTGQWFTNVLAKTGHWKSFPCVSFTFANHCPVLAQQGHPTVFAELYPGSAE